MYTAEEVAKVNDTISWLEGGDAKASEIHNGCLETHMYFASLSLIKDFRARQNDMQKRVRREREEWVREQLRQWDETKALEVERCVWGWHPLYHMCTGNSLLSRRMPPLPWKHTIEEAKTVVSALRSRTLHLLAPTSACLLRVYSILAKVEYGLVDPMTGATNSETLQKWADDTVRLEGASAMLVAVGAALFGVPDDALVDTGFTPEVSAAALKAVQDGKWTPFSKWVMHTQSRGVEDYAVSEPDIFAALWCNLSKESVCRPAGPAA